jgi:hypothetical protein
VRCDLECVKSLFFQRTLTLIKYVYWTAVQTDYVERWIFCWGGGGAFSHNCPMCFPSLSKVCGVSGDECFATLAVSLVHKTNDESGFVSWRFLGLLKIALYCNNGLTV